MRRTGKRRSRYGKSSRAPSVSMDRAIERASGETFTENSLFGGLAALAVPVVSLVLSGQNVLPSTWSAQNKRLLVGGIAFVGGLMIYDWAPMLGLGLAVGGVLFGLQPYAESAIGQLMAPAPAPAATTTTTTTQQTTTT